MAWIDKKKRSDGGVSARVVWRLGGCRDGAYQSETFSDTALSGGVVRPGGYAHCVARSGHVQHNGLNG